MFAFYVVEDLIAVLLEGCTVAGCAWIGWRRGGEIEEVDNGESFEHLVAEFGMLQREEVVGGWWQGGGEVVVDGLCFGESSFTLDEQ